MPAPTTRRPRPRLVRGAGRRRRVRARPLGRPLRRADQPRRPGLPGDDGTARRARRVDASCSPTSRAGGSPPPSRSPTTSCLHEWRDAQPRVRVAARDGADAGPRLRRRAARRRARRQPGVGDRHAAAVVPVAHDAGDRLRRRPRDRRAHRCASRRRRRTSTSPGTRRRARGPTAADGTAGAGRRRAPRRHPARRHGAGRGVRLRLLRVVARRRGSASPACRCSTAAWCGRSPTLAAAASSAGRGTSTASCCTSATRSPTRSPSPTTSSPSASSTAPGSPCAAAAPAACWSGRASRCARSASPPPSPRCRSSTSSPR